ncbi:hypothetical protein PUN28_015333 [Cardiocondyla obscurior]|uniref:Uncharacterized protein n=1 Tax=Cardiocondyla obscurior TaxID=286306 RepID=A0AAW2EU78_9HYME
MKHVAIIIIIYVAIQGKIKNLRLRKTSGLYIIILSTSRDFLIIRLLSCFIFFIFFLFFSVKITCSA